MVVEGGLNGTGGWGKEKPPECGEAKDYFKVEGKEYCSNRPDLAGIMARDGTSLTGIVVAGATIKWFSFPEKPKPPWKV